jgi:hypothetical protein
MAIVWRPYGDRMEIIHSYYRVTQLSPINRVTTEHQTSRSNRATLIFGIVQHGHDCRQCPALSP